LYYSIGEVAEMFGVSSSLIRYWETEFKVLKPMKNRKGDRRFMVKDIRTLEKIYTLVKERGFTLEGAKKELKKKPEIEKLKKVLKRLKKTKATLQSLLKDIKSREKASQMDNTSSQN